MHEHNYSFNSTLTKLVSILTKKIFSCLNPTSYLNAIFTKKLSIIYYLPPPPHLTGVSICEQRTFPAAFSVF